MNNDGHMVSEIAALRRTVSRMAASTTLPGVSVIPWTLVPTPMLNGWHNLNSSYPARYTRLSSGLVVLSGIIAGGTINQGAFILPPEVWPTGSVCHFPVSGNNSFGQLNVGGDGVVLPASPTNNTFVYLDGVSYPAAAANLPWVPISASIGLQNSWVDTSTADAARFVKLSSGLVCLAGGIKSGLTDGSPAFVLPAGCWPVANSNAQFPVCSHNLFGSLAIQSATIADTTIVAGEVQVTPPSSNLSVYLDSVRFPAAS